MCLYNQASLVRRFLAAKRKRDYIICYKIMEVVTDYEYHRGITSTVKRLRGPYQSSYCYQPGWNKSNAMRRKLKTTDCLVYQGIHVYTSKKNASYFSYYSNRVLVPVKCLVKDILGVGKGQMVFKKIYVAPQNFPQV